MTEPTTDERRSRAPWIIATAALAVLLVLAVAFFVAYTNSSRTQRERNAKIGSCVAYGVGC